MYVAKTRLLYTSNIKKDSALEPTDLLKNAKNVFGFWDNEVLSKSHTV